MLRTLHVWDTEILLEGSENDTYLAALPDEESFQDGVLDLLGVLVRDGGARSVVDIGANLGIHSLAVASLDPAVGVTAVEANPATAAWLQRNVEHNRRANVRVIQRAISDQPGSLTFCDNQEFPAGSMPLTGAPEEFVAFLRGRGQGTHAVIDVPAVRLDDLVGEFDVPAVDVLKIDVEGHDIRAIRGARETIRRHRPVVVMEFATLAISLHAGMLPSDVLREVRGLFERVYVVQEGGYLHEIANEADAIGFLEGNAVRVPVQDLVCVPAGCRFADAVRERLTDEPSRSRVDHLEEELRQAREALARREGEVATLLTERDKARSFAADLERTLSWRVTRPLRLVRERIH